MTSELFSMQIQHSSTSLLQPSAPASRPVMMTEASRGCGACEVTSRHSVACRSIDACCLISLCRRMYCLMFISRDVSMSPRLLFTCIRNPMLSCLFTYIYAVFQTHGKLNITSVSHVKCALTLWHLIRTVPRQNIVLSEPFLTWKTKDFPLISLKFFDLKTRPGLARMIKTATVLHIMGLCFECFPGEGRLQLHEDRRREQTTSEVCLKVGYISRFEMQNFFYWNLARERD